MNSYILQSDACRHCDPTQAQPWFRRMLRTPNADICTNCGAVLQTFPTLNMTVEQGEHAPIAIPAPVTAVLEELLRRRLFSVARGYNPRQAERSFDPSRTPAHRRSDQALIELAGRANCGVTIRWNYSDVELYDRARRELKTVALDTLDMLMPTRVRRGIVVAGETLDCTGLVTDERSPRHRWLRFEKSFPLAEQPLQLSKLCLVVKVEFEWYVVGESLPSESGPAVYYLGQNWDPPHMTLEEALDAALNASLDGRSGHIGYHSSINHAIHRGHQVGGYNGDPINSYDNRPRKGCGYGEYVAVGPQSRYWTNTFVGPVSSGETVLLPQNQWGLLLTLHTAARVVATIGDATLLDQELAAGKHQIDCEALLAGKLGKLIVTLKRENDVVHEFDLVDNATYDAARIRFIEDFKRAELARLKVAIRGRDARPASFCEGETVAAEIEGRWFEGVYKAPESGGTHLVEVKSFGATRLWSVFEPKTLAEALREGLNVAPPDCRDVPTGGARLVA